MQIRATGSVGSDKKVIDGLDFSEKIRKQLASIVDNLKQNYNLIPNIAIVIVGHDKASEIYVRNKIKTARFLNIKVNLIEFEENIQESILIEEIKKINKNSNIHGIIVQLPLPFGLSKDKVLSAISPEKDLDGLHPLNIGLLHSAKNVPYKITEVLDELKKYPINNNSFIEKINLLGITTPFIPCTPLGCLFLIETTLKSKNEEISGKNAIVFGNSNLVSKPMARLLLQSGATVTTLHSKSKYYQYLVENADIIVSATGKKQELINVKPEAILIDIGIRQNEDKTGITGDLDFLKLSLTNQITPVPKGVGPMTVTSLMLNSILAGMKNVVKNL